MRRILAKLDIPPLEPVPPDHVLTKAFYLLQSFPGRYDRGELWVEGGDGQAGGDGNADGVSSIMIGSNDYAAAWAIDRPMGARSSLPCPAASASANSPTAAGINIVMYALTGNYKADQVHVPALLERLGTIGAGDELGFHIRSRPAALVDRRPRRRSAWSSSRSTPMRACRAGRCASLTLAVLTLALINP